MKPAPLRWLYPLLLALLLGTLLLGSAAWAHTALLHAEPADGSVLAQAPRQALLTFGEPVTVTRLQIIEPDGSRVINDAVQLLQQNNTYTLTPQDIGYH